MPPSHRVFPTITDTSQVLDWNTFYHIRFRLTASQKVFLVETRASLIFPCRLGFSDRFEVSESICGISCAVERGNNQQQRSKFPLLYVLQTPATKHRLAKNKSESTTQKYFVSHHVRSICHKVSNMPHFIFRNTCRGAFICMTDLPSSIKRTFTRCPAWSLLEFAVTRQEDHKYTSPWAMFDYPPNNLRAHAAYIRFKN